MMHKSQKKTYLKPSVSLLDIEAEIAMLQSSGGTPRTSNQTVENAFENNVEEDI